MTQDKKNQTDNFFIRFLKRILNIKKKTRLLDGNECNEEKQVQQVQEKNFNKNITLFLYKQVRLGKLNPKYISKEYLDKIIILANEERKIKKSKLEQINQEMSSRKDGLYD